MKRPGLGVLAIAIAVVVVFAPRPSGSNKGAYGEAPLIGRVLAPTFDAAHTLEQNHADPNRKPGSALWPEGVAAVAVTPLAQSLDLRDPLSRLPKTGLDSRASRAPPSRS